MLSESKSMAYRSQAAFGAGLRRSSAGSKGSSTYWPGCRVRSTFGVSTPFHVMMMGSVCVMVPSREPVKRIGFMQR